MTKKVKRPKVKISTASIGDIVFCRVENRKPSFYRLVSTTSDFRAWLIEVRKFAGEYIQMSVDIKMVSWDEDCIRI